MNSAHTMHLKRHALSAALVLLLCCSLAQSSIYLKKYFDEDDLLLKYPQFYPNKNARVKEHAVASRPAHGVKAITRDPFLKSEKRESTGESTTTPAPSFKDTAHIAHSCKDIWCRPGRQCQVTNSGAICICLTPRQCKGHHKPICGSDGVMYASHCHLHQVACLQHKPIQLDNSGKKCHLRDLGKHGLQQKTENVMRNKNIHTDDVVKTQAEKVSRIAEKELKNKIPSRKKDLSFPKSGNYKSEKHHYLAENKDVQLEKAGHQKDTKNRGKKEHGGRKFAKRKHHDHKKYGGHGKKHLAAKKMSRHTHEVRGESAHKKSIHHESKPKKGHEKTLTSIRTNAKLNEKGENSGIERKVSVSERKSATTSQKVRKDENFNEYFHRIVKNFKQERKTKELTKARNELGSKLDTVTTTTKKIQAATTRKPSTTTSPMASTDLNECTDEDFNKFKSNLLIYHCKRTNIDCNNKAFLANIMFTYYDDNLDGSLVRKELDYIHIRDNLDKVSGGKCQLSDLLFFDDQSDLDEKLTREEFFGAFNILELHLDDDMAVSKYVVNQGKYNAVEMKCAIQGMNEVQWTRHGVDLDSLNNLDSIKSTEIMVLSDNSLFITNIGLHHTGNYTCQQRGDDHIKQLHILKVQVAPEVQVTPSTRYYGSGSDVKIQCHSSGLPQTTLSWKVNEVNVPLDPEGKHFVRQNNGHTLLIKNARYKQDAGAYKCVASNAAGDAQGISTVFVGAKKKPIEPPLGELVAVFHDKGYSAYNLDHCSSVHHSVATKTKLDHLKKDLAESTLCAHTGEPCSWGSAVNVNQKYMYVSQPGLDRIIVFDLKKMLKPIEVIKTDPHPTDLHYIAGVDQVWILAGTPGTTHTVQVVKHASEPAAHLPIHTQSVGSHFDQVDNLFIAPSYDLPYVFDHGYIKHVGKSLQKMHVPTLKYVSSLDLKMYNCVPTDVIFIPIAGHILISCEPIAGVARNHLIVDYVTDAVISTLDVSGDAHLSPDSRIVVFTDAAKIKVFSIGEDGTFTPKFEIKPLPVTPELVTYFPSSRGHGYDMYVGSSSSHAVGRVDLSSGTVRLIQGTSKLMAKMYTGLSSGGVFSHYLAATSNHSLVVINGRLHISQCELPYINNGHTISWFKYTTQLD